MAETSEPSIMDQRRDQMFLRFSDDDLVRLARFGEPRSYKSGDMLARVGEVGPGLMLILSGRVEVTRPVRRRAGANHYP